MPRGDRTGPTGAGPMTGRRAGFCAEHNTAGFQTTGRGFGRGCGRGLGFRSQHGQSELKAQMNRIEKRLDEAQLRP